MSGSQKRSVLLSWLLHCGAILLILATTGAKPALFKNLRDVLVIPADLQNYHRPASSADGGGGGGAHADSPASRGRLPRFATHQFVPPSVDTPNPTPILPMEPTLIGDPEIKLADFHHANYGLPNGVAGRLSGGPGDGGGIGSGHGTGAGPGTGPGYGPGEGGGMDGGVSSLGARMGSVTPPSVLWKVEPEYTEEARKARLQGTVLLRIEIDANGQARNLSVRQSLGLGLDECAMEAVRRWKFSPGKVNGKAAAVVAYVEVNFRLL